MRPLKVAAAAFVAIAAILGLSCQSIQRKALFYPTHEVRNNGLVQWKIDSEAVGYAREVEQPRSVWLLLHGNGGQAADRIYALSAFAEDDSVFILEYPGYGLRAGKPSRASIDAAARQAFAALRARFPDIPVCVGAESIGSGPASMLAGESHAPDKLVFVVPFDTLMSVARDYVKYLPVGLLLAGSWNNVRALAGYRGPIEVFGAERDTIIPVAHARALAASLPQAQFHLIPGGHNDWSGMPAVRFRNP